MIRVLVDTNVIISALLFPNSTPARALQVVLDEHRLVLTQWIIDELHEVVDRKRPDLLGALDELLSALQYEMVLTVTDSAVDGVAGFVDVGCV